jgi:hypothetical protein
MRRYYLHRCKGVYYAEIVTHEGKRLTAKSTGKKPKMRPCWLLQNGLMRESPLNKASQNQLKPLSVLTVS